MAVTAEKLELPVRKERADSGLLGWFRSVDHKRIGVLYILTAVVFLLVIAFEALLMRLQLMKPLNTLVTGDTYNALVTQHGTVGIFFVATPLIWGILNYVVPLQLGARDVAFPRLNLFTWYLTLAGGIIINAAWFLGGAADAGWFAYVPLSGEQFSPGVGMDAYLVGVTLGMLGTFLTGVNLVVTILRMRAPGMTLLRMPSLAWYTLMSMILAITSGVPYIVAMVLLLFDRWFGTGFYAPTAGGDELLWQHLFWLFGHPEVYVLVLPAYGMISEILPTFSRKPFFGYKAQVAAICSIGIVGWIVWGHHLYTAGMGTAANTYFVIGTKAVSVPTAMVLFNWLATLWGGKISFRLPMAWATAFLFVFMVGGLTGLVNASSSVDRQFQDNMWVVGHFHWMVWAIVLAVFAGFLYWWPKITGRMLNEKLGRASLWFIVLGAGGISGPMFVEGLMGMPRRVYTYLPEQGWGALNAVATVGALVMGVGVLLLVVTWLESLIRGQRAPGDAWGDGRTLEWAVPSPAPAYNFARLPVVEGRDAWWDAKVNRGGRLQYAPEELDHGRHGNLVHMPSPSWMPALTALGFLVGGFGGILRNPTVALVGLVIVGLGILGWALENWKGYYLVVEEGDA